ncbi:MAG: helical backbone metal receptor [Thermoanaerobaculia bacterium]
MILDALGRRHDFNRPPSRVVSLVPSLTETLFAIGAGNAVVATTAFCIFPETEVSRLPRVGGTKNPNIDAIRELAPDLVYVNVEENLRHHADAIAEFVPVFATEPKSVDDAAALVRLLGRIHDVASRADAIADAIAEETRLAAADAKSFRFACAIWKDPWMWCGGDTYVSDLVAAAGGANVLADATRYPRLDLGDLLDLTPDVVFLPDEPYAFTDVDHDAVSRAGVRVVGPFPGHLFTWHGARTLEGLRFLRAAMRRGADGDPR